VLFYKAIQVKSITIVWKIKTFSDQNFSNIVKKQ